MSTDSNLAVLTTGASYEATQNAEFTIEEALHEECTSGPPEECSSSPDAWRNSAVIMSIVWLEMLYTYEIWCLDLGYRAIDELHQELNGFWDSL